MTKSSGKDLWRLKVAFTVGCGALKLKYFALCLAVLSLQGFIVYHAYDDIVSAMPAPDTAIGVALTYGFLFMMCGWVANTLIARLSYGLVVLRNIRKKDPLF